MPRTIAAKKSSSPRSKTIKAVVIDDHELVCRGFAEVISQADDMTYCGDAQTIDKGLALIKAKRPDVAIVDITLREGNGVELIREIKELSPDCKVLVASMHDEAMYAERVLKVGASGFINKRATPDAILLAIRQIMFGVLHFSPRLTDRLLRKNPEGGGTTFRSSVDRLSAREREIFEYVGKGIPTRQIAVLIGVSVKTVETHRENIKRKLRLRSSVELARRAISWNLESSSPSESESPRT